MNDALSDAAGCEAWDASLSRRLDKAMIISPLSADIATEAVQLVRSLGFAIIESAPSDLTETAIRQRSNELQSFAAALGVPVVQSPRRQLVEDVKDYSDIEAQDDRGYRSGGELTAHSDPPTIILLHCLQPAKEGGESSLVSVASIVEQMTAHDPDLVEQLFEPLPDWRVAGQYGIADAGAADDPRPVLARHNGILSCVLYRPYIEKAAEATGTNLTDTQVAALDRFEEYSMAEDLTLRFVLESGQTLVLHNRSVLHARTDFIDWPELSRRRHLLRMWIDAPEAFPVHPNHQLGDFFSPFSAA